MATDERATLCEIDTLSLFMYLFNPGTVGDVG